MNSVLEVCRLAGVDRDRLNEAIARGDYPCAPATRPGSRRIFAEADFIVLSVYGALTARGIPPRVAGAVACSSLSAIENAPYAEHLAIIWERDGRVKGVTPDVEGASAMMKVPTQSEYESGDPDARHRAHFPIASVEIMNIAAFRGKFRFALARKKWEESNTLVFEEDETEAAISAVRKGLRGEDGASQ